MFKLALAQMAHPEDGDVVTAVRTWARRAQEKGAQLLVFPECLMTPFEKTPAEFATSAQPVDGAFSQAMGEIARSNKLWMVFTLNERNPLGGAPYNTAAIIDSDGILRGSYRKTHLYAAHGLDEHEKMSPGDTLFTPIETPFCTLGLGICYDLRFPESARIAALSGCEVLLYPAAWVSGPCKTWHWSTLLAARAIENELFVAGCCRPDRNCVGHSQVVNPLGEVIAQAGEGEQLVVANIELEQMRKAREGMPCLQHRRPSLYGALTEGRQRPAADIPHPPAQPQAASPAPTPAQSRAASPASAPAQPQAASPTSAPAQPQAASPTSAPAQQPIPSLPDFLESELRAAYGTLTANILDGYAQKRPTTLRANTLRATREEVAAQLAAQGFSYRSVPWYADAFILEGNAPGSFWDSALVTEGAVYVQGLSSMLPPLFMRLARNTDILDMCAAPGSKTTQLAALAQHMTGKTAHITACEQNAVRADKLLFNLHRQGAESVNVLRQDARRLDRFLSFDRILLDAPCSGSGTLSVHDPKLKKRFSEALVSDSCKKQAALLSKALEIVKPGGIVLYSTCSILKRENEAIVSAALKRAAKTGRYTIDALDEAWFAQQGIPLLPSTIDGAITVCPTGLYEGFFMCRIMRQA